MQEFRQGEAKKVVERRSSVTAWGGATDVGITTDTSADRRKSREMGESVTGISEDRSVPLYEPDGKNAAAVGP
jgi:hypothetical protein